MRRSCAGRRHSDSRRVSVHRHQLPRKQGPYSHCCERCLRAAIGTTPPHTGERSRNMWLSDDTAPAENVTGQGASHRVALHCSHEHADGTPVARLMHAANLEHPNTARSAPCRFRPPGTMHAPVRWGARRLCPINLHAGGLPHTGSFCPAGACTAAVNAACLHCKRRMQHGAVLCRRRCLRLQAEGG